MRPVPLVAVEFMQNTDTDTQTRTHTHHTHTYNALDSIRRHGYKTKVEVCVVCVYVCTISLLALSLSQSLTYFAAGESGSRVFTKKHHCSKTKCKQKNPT